MPVIKHTHIYKRFSKTQYQCADPYCTHIQTVDRLIGKATRCNVCKVTEFVLTRKDLKLAMPRCVNCSNSKASRTFREKQTALQSTLNDLLNPPLFVTPVVEEKEEEKNNA